jgi:hypothetical protein
MFLIDYPDKGHTNHAPASDTDALRPTAGQL